MNSDIVTCSPLIGQKNFGILKTSLTDTIDINKNF